MPKSRWRKKTLTKSTTAPDVGMFVKGDHKKQMVYEVHTVRNQHGSVPEAEETPGNAHDSIASDDVYSRKRAFFNRKQGGILCRSA